MGHSQYRSQIVEAFSKDTYLYSKIIRNIHSYVNHMMPLYLQCVFYVYHICMDGCIYMHVYVKSEIKFLHLLLSTLLSFENITIAFADLYIYLFVHAHVCVCVGTCFLLCIYVGVRRQHRRVGSVLPKCGSQ